MTIEENVPLGTYTTFKVGGTARFLISGEGAADIQSAKQFAGERGLPFVVLGGGSNMLLDDGTMDSVFYRPQNRGIDEEVGSDGALLVAGAAEVWDRVVAYATEHGFYGLENLSGIPGSVGGAAVQNIGAYGAALSNTVSWVEAFDLKENKIQKRTAAECAYGYRNSIFKMEPYRFVIMRVALLLSREARVDISYKDLREMFAGTAPSPAEVRDAVLAIRARKFPDLSLEGTAGSFFKNPIISKEEAEVLHARFPEAPLYIVPEERGVKVPLAWFLDHVLSLRDFRQGHVRCFIHQPLVLVAAPGASAKEVRALAHFVQMKVFDEIGLKITPEVCVLNKNILTSAVDF